MGIGSLYAKILRELGHNVITVDQDVSKNADVLSIDDAVLKLYMFDTVHICTPNFTHEPIARRLAPISKIIFIEKPGVATKADWIKLVTDFPDTRFIMVKNNMWRSNINEFEKLANSAKKVNIRWLRKNCIPNPGSWFTTKKLAFGGVSRDLMPHLLSLYIAMNRDWNQENVSGNSAVQCWNLKDIDSTEYGTVNPEGTYNVDDVNVINFGNKWKCEANWRNMLMDDSSVEFIIEDNSVVKLELGWCPEDAYIKMITDTITNLENPYFWINQFKIDCWIHEQIEKF